MICANCKKEYNGYARECPYCGALLKTFTEAHPPVTQVVVKPVGKIVAGISVIFALVSLIVAGVLFVLSLSPAEADKPKDESKVGEPGAEVVEEEETEPAWVEQRNNAIAEVRRKGDIGSDVNYTQLIAARHALDSLLSVYGDHADLVTVKEELERKQKMAADAWIKAGDAQYNIAENVQGALKYYQRADSIYPGYRRIPEALTAMAAKSRLTGARLFIGGITRHGNSFTIRYKYFGDSETTVALKFEQEDTGRTTTVNVNLKPSTKNYSIATVNSSFLDLYSGDVDIYEKNELIYIITPETE